MVKNPNNFPHNGLVDSIRVQATHFLSEHASHEEYLQHAFALCDSVARRLDMHQTKFLLTCKDPRACTAGRSSYSPFPSLDYIDNPLATAAALGLKEQLCHLLQQQTKSNFDSSLHGQLVAAAALMERSEIIQILFLHQEKTTGKTGSKDTYAHAAASASRFGHLDILQRAMACVYFDDDDYSTYARLAVADGHLDVFVWLLTRVPEERRKDILKSNLFVASFSGRLDFVEEILRSGISVNTLDSVGNNALHYAAGGGYHRLVRLLLESGIQYFRTPRSDPVALAAKNGHQEVVAILFDHPAAFNVKALNRDVFVQAAKNGEVSMMRLLRAREAEIRISDVGDLALEKAAERGHVDAV